MRTYDMITAKLTGAVRQVGNGDEDDLSAIKYRPKLADDLREASFEIVSTWSVPTRSWLT